MQDLLSIGTNRRESMIGTGIGLGLAGYRLNPPGGQVLDLRFSADKNILAFSGPNPTYTRASTGTFFNSQGALTSFAINEPRFNHVYNGTAWASKGLLLEEQKTNLALYSEQFGNAVWAINAATISANAVSAPDGNTTADKIQETSSGGTTSPYINQSINYTSGNQYTLSCFVKAAERNYVVLGWYQNSTDYAAVFNLADGTVSNTYGGATANTATNVGNGWWRCAVTFNCTGTGTGSTIAGPRLTGSYANYSPTAGSGIYLWGSQVEIGGFPTSYTSTTNSTSIRSASVCQIGVNDFSRMWNALEGTLLLEADTPANGTNPLVCVDDNTSSERIEISGIGNDPKVLVVDGGSTQVDIDAGTISNGTGFKLAFAYKLNDFAVSLNGGTVATDSAGTLPSVNRLRIGSNQAGNYLNGHIARLLYYPTRLTNAKLQELST